MFFFFSIKCFTERSNIMSQMHASKQHTGCKGKSKRSLSAGRGSHHSNLFTLEAVEVVYSWHLHRGTTFGVNLRQALSAGNMNNSHRLGRSLTVLFVKGWQQIKGAFWDDKARHGEISSGGSTYWYSRPGNDACLWCSYRRLYFSNSLKLLRLLRLINV